MNKKVSVLLAVAALFVASLACSLFAGGSAEMSLENLRMAFDQEGNSPTTEFSSSDIFYVVGDLQNAPAGTVVEAKWLAVQIEGYDPGELIYEQAISDFTDESFTGTIYFQLSNDAGWPAGEYKVDVYLNGVFVQSASFSVR
jgi:hypothetical protein